MQPETDSVTEENSAAHRENKKKISSIDQWDAVAFKLIKDELAPKGFSEIKRGPYRGKVQANIPFLAKGQVERCQKVAAQLVRSFRVNFQKEVTEQVITCESRVDMYKKDLSGCGLFQFKKKADLRAKITEYGIKAKYSKAIIERLNLVSIK